LGPEYWTAGKSVKNSIKRKNYIMKRLIKTILACGVVAVCATVAKAAPTMRLSADGGATWLTIPDNSALDADPTTDGSIIYFGPVGPWIVNIASAIGSPAVGAATSPVLDVGTTTTSPGAQTLIVQISDVDYVGFPNETFIARIGVSTTGSITYNTYIDSGNVLFGSKSTYSSDAPGVSPSPTAALLLAEGPLVNTSVVYSNAVVVANPAAKHSLTLETLITESGAGSKSTVDALLYNLPPPPCNCTLTFNSPQSITNCAGDTIPDVTASQDCGAGPLNVPVTFVSATTNGSCPSIITRNYTAMDACGNVYPFTQTITVNCKGNICGHVFADCDGNGDLTQGDVGIGKVTVTLTDANKKVIGTITTDANGGYCFTNLAGGNYVVCINAPSGYCQTAASTSYHWRDSYGRTCWQENDGYIHCLSSGTECWWDKYNTCHWKDSYNRDCWKDNWGTVRCQPLCYNSCNAPSNNNCISVCLTNCTSLTDVDFAYTGTKPSLSVTCSGPSTVKCGQSYTYTCTVVNNGNVCFKGGNVCTTVGNCNYWGGWSNCNNYTGSCPPLSPGQSCKVTVKCSFNSWNCGTVTCQSQVSCTHKSGTCSGQDSCNSQCSYW
jgi:hypothetical protein